MLAKIIPAELLNMITANYDLEFIYEIRIRRNMPICINVAGKYFELRSQRDKKIVFADKRLIDYILLKATDSSLYCYNNQLKNCFIASVGGLRIGVCGEVVYDDNKSIKTIKNISSLNIRIPHEVVNCSKPIQKFIMNENGINNCLIISPPCCGKTTFIRDIARIIGSSGKVLNTLIIDERFEICAGNNGEQSLNVGLYADCMSGSSKNLAFTEGVRSLRPDVIICDELAKKEDVDAVKLAINSGVKVIATAHSDSFMNFRRRTYFKELINEQYIDFYIFLSMRNGAGTIDAVFNKELRPVWGWILWNIYYVWALLLGLVILGCVLEIIYQKEFNFMQNLLIF